MEYFIDAFKKIIQILKEEQEGKLTGCLCFSI